MSFDPQSAINGLFGVLIGSGIVALWLSSREKRVSSLETEVTGLRDRTVRDLSAAFGKHVDNDASKATAVQLEIISRQLRDIDNNVGLTREEIAELKAQRTDDREFLRNVNAAFREHVRENHP